MNSYAARQANVGYQISNLGILWGVVIIHIINAGYAFYGLLNSGGGEIVLCFLALCLFSIGRWMCVCCESPPRDNPRNVPVGNYGRGLKQLPDLQLVDGSPKDKCPPVNSRTPSYYYPNNTGDLALASTDNPVDVSVIRRPADVLARRERCDTRSSDYALPNPSPVYNQPYTDCGLPYNQKRRSSTSYAYGDDKWRSGTCDSNITESDVDVLDRDCKVERARVFPADIDVYMPEAHFYNDMDSVQNGEYAIPQEDGRFSECERSELARDKLRAQAKRNVVYREVDGARSAASSISYKVKTGPPKFAQMTSRDARTGPTVIKKTRVRSFSPIPEDERRCDPLNMPPRGFNPEPPPRRQIKYVSSTRGIQEFMQGECTRPNVYVDDQQRKDIERYYRGIDNECEDVDIVRDWPPLSCLSDDDYYSSAARPAADENVLPVPNRGSVRNQEWIPEPGSCDNRMFCGDQPRRSMFVTMKEDRNNKKVRANARRRGRKFHGRDTNPRPNVLVAVPDEDDGKGSVNVTMKRNRKLRTALPARFQTRNRRKHEGNPSNSNLPKAAPLSVLLVVLAVSALFLNPKFFVEQNVFGSSGKAVGYVLAASSYTLFQAAKKLIDAN